MYQPKFHPKADKDISKLDKKLRKDIRYKHIIKILDDPYRAGESLTGKLTGLKQIIRRRGSKERVEKRREESNEKEGQFFTLDNYIMNDFVRSLF